MDSHGACPLETSIPHHPQPGDAAEMFGVVCDQRQGVGERRCGDPMVVGSDEQVFRTQMPGGDRVVLRRGMIHGQHFEAGQHGGTGRMMDVAKALGEFSGYGPANTWPGGLMLPQKLVGFARTTAHFPSEIDEKAGVEKETVHAQGSSGGVSCF